MTEHTTPEDEDTSHALIASACLGDRDAVCRLVRRYQPVARAYAMSILHNWHDAEDATQEALIDVCRGLGGLRETKAFPAWLRRVVFKHCDRILRRTRPVTVPIDGQVMAASDTQRPAVVLEQEAIGCSLAKAIAALPPRQREAITLFYRDGMLQREIASRLGVPLSTVKKRLHDARADLRTEMSRQGW